MSFLLSNDTVITISQILHLIASMPHVPCHHRVQFELKEWRVFNFSLFLPALFSLLQPVLFIDVSHSHYIHIVLIMTNPALYKIESQSCVVSV